MPTHKVQIGDGAGGYTDGLYLYVFYGLMTTRVYVMDSEDA
jgi:hypothetical protein